MKTCPKCKEIKIFEDFHKLKRSKNGLSSWCKKCKSEDSREHYLKNSARIIKRTGENAKKNPNSKKRRHDDYIKNKERDRIGNRRRRLDGYGLTFEDYDRMLSEQNNSCKICKESPKYTLRVDHSHKTSKVRGLLCNECNKGLGLFKDNPTLLRKAADYLNEYGHYAKQPIDNPKKAP
jgi:Autographiviridae endonuclease VII